MKSFNKIVAIAMLAGTFCAGAFGWSNATELLAEAKAAQVKDNSKSLYEHMETLSGINQYTLYYAATDYEITVDELQKVIDANTGLLFQTKRVLDNKLTKFVGSAFVLGGTIYAGNKYKTQLGDVTKKLGTKIVDGYNKVNGPKAVAFIKETALKFWNKLPNFKKQAVQAVKKVTVDQTTYNNYDGVMNTL